MGADLKAQLLEVQGPLCIIPGCDERWTDKAHVEPSGMGGRPSMLRVENLAGMCHEHHMIFDGHQMHGRQRLLRILMAHLVKNTRQSWRD